MVIIVLMIVIVSIVVATTIITILVMTRLIAIMILEVVNVNDDGDRAMQAMVVSLPMLVVVSLGMVIDKCRKRVFF